MDWMHHVPTRFPDSQGIFVGTGCKACPAFVSVVDPTSTCDITYESQTVWVLDIASSMTHEVTTGLKVNVRMLRQ